MVSPTRRSARCSTGRAMPTTTSSPRRRAPSPRQCGSDAPPEQRAEAKAQLARLKARLAQVTAIDFFGANGREAAEGLLAELEGRLREKESRRSRPSRRRPTEPRRAQGRTWVTRQGVHVDRIASAWLIRRFVDPEARFKFVPAKGYVPEPGELRFDMFEAEFTHEGDRCTFEVLLERVGLDEPALRAIAEIVHDIDLKDGKFGRPEAAGIKTLIAGICAATGDDEERLARGGAVFEDLYAYFRRKTPMIGARARSGLTRCRRATGVPRRRTAFPSPRRCGPGRGSRRSASAAPPARSR